MRIIGILLLIGLVASIVSWIAENIWVIFGVIAIVFAIIAYMQKRRVDADNLNLALDLLKKVKSRLSVMVRRKGDLNSPDDFFQAFSDFAFRLEEFKTPALASNNKEMIDYVHSGSLEIEANQHVRDYVDMAADHFRQEIQQHGYQWTICNALDSYQFQLRLYDYQLSEQTSAHCSKKLKTVQTFLSETKEKEEREQEEKERLLREQEQQNLLEARKPPEEDDFKKLVAEFMRQKQLELNGGKKYSTKYCDFMEGREFEKFCAGILAENGFTKVVITPNSGNQGIDILAEKAGVKYGIQCKRQSSGVGNKAVQEAFTGKTFHNCHVGVVLTNRHFTPSAKEVAAKTGVLLWDRDRLEEMTDIANMRYASNADTPPALTAPSDPQTLPEPAAKDDELYWDAVKIIVRTGMASVSMLQRRLKLGYSRAARLVDQMEEDGIVGPFQGSKPREVLMTEKMLQSLKQNPTKSEEIPCQTKNQEIPV